MNSTPAPKFSFKIYEFLNILLTSPMACILTTYCNISASLPSSCLLPPLSFPPPMALTRQRYMRSFSLLSKVPFHRTYHGNNVQRAGILLYVWFLFFPSNSSTTNIQTCGVPSRTSYIAHYSGKIIKRERAEGRKRWREERTIRGREVAGERMGEYLQQVWDTGRSESPIQCCENSHKWKEYLRK